MGWYWGNLINPLNLRVLKSIHLQCLWSALNTKYKTCNCKEKSRRAREEGLFGTPGEFLPTRAGVWKNPKMG